MEDLMIIILAAGEGTRMNSEYNKMIHELAGKSMLNHVVEKALSLTDNVICVVGHQADKVRKSISAPGKVKFVEQKEQLGTGDAVWQAKDHLQEHEGRCLVLYGDTPLLKIETIKNLLHNHKHAQAGMSLLTANLDDPTGYGRMVRDEDDAIIGIIEEDDTDEKTRQIQEVNAGVYSFNSQLLLTGLKKIDNENNQGEYYLTDVIDYISEKAPLASYNTSPDEIIGINNRQALARAEEIMQNRIKHKHMENGVTLIDPERIHIEKDVVIERDTIIYPGTVIKSGCRIGEGCYIGPNCQLENVNLARNVRVKMGSFIIDSEIASGTRVGPYAHLRPGSKIGEDCKVGNFVELKKTKVAKNSKIPHLSYVGDGIIGSGCNIGAGAIFANYDGENKHETVLGDEVFIGSNSTLVAPVELGDGSSTGAGSVVTKDVEEKSIVMGVPARFYKKKE